jgi:hypothetical protein
VDAFVKVEFRSTTAEVLNAETYVLQACQLDPGCPNPMWRIGQTIQPSSIIIIGAVHVSAGSWMPILQLNRYIF